MTIDALKLRIDTPTGETFPGRGFYQLEEDSLYVQVGPFSRMHRFFSYLESDHVRLDLDKEGRLLFIEVDCPRHCWGVDTRVKPPNQAIPADIRWLDFRKHMSDPELLTNKRRTFLLLRFQSQFSVRNYLLARSVAIDVTDKSELAAIWVSDIVDDVAGLGIADFRKNSCPREEN